MQNREAVTKFCLRGAPGGKRGPRPVSAPLCDPTAIPALEHWDAADAGGRPGKKGVQQQAADGRAAGGVRHGSHAMPDMS